MKALALAQAARVTLWRDGDGIGYDGEMTPALADAITAERSALLAVLPCQAPEDGLTLIDPDDAHTAETQAIADGWTRNADGSWEFPADWATLYPRTPDRQIALPADEEPLPRLHPLAEAQERQLRTAGAPMPTGISYGQTKTGQWRRLT